MTKRRKIIYSRLVLVCILFLLVSIGFLFILRLLFINTNNHVEFDINNYMSKGIDYDTKKTLDLDLYSKDYLLIRLNDFEVLYANNNDEKIYPASLTKVLTMDTVIKMCDDLNDLSSYSNEQYYQLINDNASLANIKTNKEYTIKDLLYALILPSGADAAKALENYADNIGINLVDNMNYLCNKLELNNSHFTNTIGLHDPDLYTTLDDYSKIVIDSLRNKESKKILKSLSYNIDDELLLKSTLFDLSDRKDSIKIYGGKTGFTDEAGMNIFVLYKVNNRSYLLILANADGNPYIDGALHIDDVNKIFNYLYNN